MNGTARPARRPASPRLIAAAGLALLGVGLLANEGLRRVGGSADTATFDPADLATLSPPDRLELVLLGALAVLRLVAVRVAPRRLLLPWLDLPLLGFLVAVSGGSFSPLDPTLALVYVAALLFLRGAESGRAPPRRVAIELLIGLVGLHGLVLRHDRQRLAHGLADELGRVRASIARTRNDTGDALRTVTEGLAELPDEAAVAQSAAAAGSAPARLFGELAGRLRAAQEGFARFLARLDASSSTETLGDAKQALEEELDAIYGDFFAARARWQPLPLAATASGAVESLDRLRETQWNLRQELLARMDDVEQVLARRDRMQARQDDFLRAASLRRVALVAALLLFAVVAIKLRDRLAAAVREAEERRARRDVEASARETDHWIAVTAGLTHGLGNDILAYDVWLAQLQEALAGAAVPDAVRARLRFLADSNRGRLGFLRFLDAFARQRQAAAGDAPPPPTEPVELVPLLERVRRNLAEVESADLPPEGSDPGVDRQLRKLRDLPLAIRCETPAAGTLGRSQRGLVEFVAYELLKNALRSATGTRPLVATLTRSARGVELALENDVQVDAATGRCAVCGADGELRKIRRRRDAPATCAACFGPALQQLLDESFAPGKGSGTGLGLFLIRYFLSTFWKSDVRARVVDAATPTVRFAVELPETP